MFMKPRKFVAVIMSLLLLTACGSPDTKKAKFFSRGTELFDQGDYVKARLEFKNAIQIDLDYAEAYYMLGMTELKQGNFRPAYGALMKAVELKPDLDEARLELGRLLLGGKALDRAAEAADLLLSHNPTNPDFRQFKASVLLAANKLEEAEKILLDLLAKGRTNPDIFLVLASVYGRGNDLDKMEDFLRQGVAKNPDSPNLHLALARFYAQRQQVDQAVLQLREVIRLAPENSAYKFNLASLLWDNAQEEAAEEVIAVAIAAAPEDEEILVRAGQFYIAKKKLGEAEIRIKEYLGRKNESYKLRFLLSELYLNQRKLDEAAALLEECLTLDKDSPDIIQAKNGLAKISLLRGDTKTAQRYTDEVLAENPKSVDAHFIKGALYLHDGDGESAVAEFRTAVSERPEFVQAWLRLAQAHIMNKQNNLAEDTLKNGLEAAGAPRDLGVALARLYIAEKKFDMAEEQYRKMLTANADDLQIHALLGDLFSIQEKFDLAAVEYEILLEKAPDSPVGYLRQCGLLLKQKKTDGALAILEKGYQAHPQPLLLASLVKLAIANGQHKKAEAVCRKRLEEDGKDAMAHDLLGLALAAGKDYSGAEQAFSKAIELTPLWLEPHTNLARLFIVQGNPEAAIAKFKEAIKVNPEKLSLFLSLGLLYEQTRNYDKAIKIYEDALRQNDNFWPAANNLAFILAEYGPAAELDRALALAGKAREIRPEDAEVLDTLGWIHLKRDETSKALAILEEAAGKAPDSPVINYHLAIALHKSGRDIEARQKVEKALEQTTPFAGREKAEALLAELKENT